MVNSLVDRITELTEFHIGNPEFGVEELARELGMSHSSLLRKVHQLTGKSVACLMRETRLRIAHKLIQNDDLTVSEAAYRVGFSSPSYFITSFHEQYGYPPGEVKKRNLTAKKQEIESLAKQPAPVKNSRHRGKIRIFKKYWWTLPFTLIGLLLVLTSFRAIRRAIHENREAGRALELADSLYRQNRPLLVYYALQKVRKNQRNSPLFIKYDSLTSTHTTILTDPPGARVYYRIYDRDSLNWHYLGVTPLDSVKVPVAVYADILMVKRGYDTVIGRHWFPERFRRGRPNLYCYRKLFPAGTVPDGMVHVCRRINNTLYSIFMDRYEVTNGQYKKFVDQGGYQNREYWKYPFVRDGVTLTWEEAMESFRDEYSWPGPATWKRGNYPKDQNEHYPVCGVSWYEAAAYAEYAGKELPAYIHRGAIASEGSRYAIANICNSGPVPVGTLSRINHYGALDMAGNVREWCCNGNSQGSKWISGGGWLDDIKMAQQGIPLSPWDRSEMNGFRCVIYLNRDSLPADQFSNRDYPYPVSLIPDTLKVLPEKEYQRLKHFYDYDQAPLESVCLERDTSQPDWIFEKVEFTTPTPGGRMLAFLWIPKQASPPYQVIIESPNIQVYEEGASQTWIDTHPAFIGPFLRAGYAWMNPMFARTWERRSVKVPFTREGDFIGKKMFVTDFRRSLDYLESRPEVFDPGGFIVYGTSWGSHLTPFITAVDDRIDAIIFNKGGVFIGQQDLPQARTIHFLPYVKVPAFVFAGKYDPWWGFKDLEMMYRLLGTREGEKELYKYLGMEWVNPPELYSTTLSFLDRHLGPAKKR